jgi:hypothetical protein
MNLFGIARRITAVALMASLPSAGFAACEARSGPRTAALIELYTSEGCSSCPPAEQRLSRLSQTLDPAAVVVPLALHVAYWDYIGWKDPYAQSAFEQRQDWLVHANRGNTLYTPQIFVGGSELRAWRGGLREEVRRLNALPAAAAISLRAGIGTDGALALEAEATAHAGGDPVALYLALAENGLLSRVARGENGGKVLAHDHVVRAWIGPIRLASGKARVRRELALPAAWNRAGLELVVFVQDERSGAVLQALNAQQCAAS